MSGEHPHSDTNFERSEDPLIAAVNDRNIPERPNHAVETLATSAIAAELVNDELDATHVALGHVFFPRGIQHVD